MSKLYFLFFYILMFNFVVHGMHESISPNPYEVLHVNNNASEQEINRSYRKLSMQHHPDRGGSQGVMQEINEAKALLLQKCQVDDCESEWHLMVKLPCDHTVCSDHLLESRDINTQDVIYSCPVPGCVQSEIHDENTETIEAQLRKQSLALRFYEQMFTERKINSGVNWWCVACGSFIGSHGITLPTCGHDVCPTCIENGIKNCASTAWCVGSKVPISEEQLYNLRQELPGKNELIVQQKHKIKMVTLKTAIGFAGISGIGYYLYTQWKRYNKKKKQAKKREKEEQKKRDAKLINTVYRHYSMQNE